MPVLRRGEVVGVINLQHRLPHTHSRREIKLILTIGFLVGAEVELARLESEISELSEQLQTPATLRLGMKNVVGPKRIESLTFCLLAPRMVLQTNDYGIISLHR